MPFNADSFLSSPLTNLGIGLLSVRQGEPIGTGLLAGMQSYQNQQQLAAQRAQEERLGKYQAAQMQNMTQDNQYRSQLMAAKQQELALQQEWAAAIASGNIAKANSIDPVTTAEYLQKITPKEKNLSDYERWQQDPAAFQKYKRDSQAPPQPRQPTEFEQKRAWQQQDPEGFAQFMASQRVPQAPTPVVIRDGTGKERVVYSDQANLEAVQGLAQVGLPGDTGDGVAVQVGNTKINQTEEGAAGLGPLTPSAIDTAATRYLIDGTLPPMGMGKAAAAGRSAILNRAAELGEQSGQTPEEQRQFQIGTSVNKTAMSQLAKQKTMVGAFEKNFVKNADLALGLSNSFDRSGVPLVNKWINAGKRSVTGDPELSKLDIAVKATVNEYAKIISGSMGNTVLAEGEIKKVESLLNAAQTPGQVQEVINFMKLETKNRMAGFEEQEKELREGMKLPGAKPPGKKPITIGRFQVEVN